MNADAGFTRFGLDTGERSMAACPVTGAAGRPVDLITLKAQLRPHALARLDPAARYSFCPDPTCDTVYFAAGSLLSRADLKVPVLAKDAAEDVPVCYCFGWTRDRLRQDLVASSRGRAVNEIRGHILAGRCGCEVNNPKGSCCLADVERFVAEARLAHPPAPGPTSD